MFQLCVMCCYRFIPPLQGDEHHDVPVKLENDDNSIDNNGNDDDVRAVKLESSGGQDLQIKKEQAGDSCSVNHSAPGGSNGSSDVQLAPCKAEANDIKFEKQ